MEPKNELQRNAIAEARRKELETYQRALDIQWLNSRMEGGRMSRCLALIQKEAEMEKEFQERTDHASIVNARAEKEIALGIEVAKVRNEEICNLQRRHYLRERDPSLRELVKKLHAGYICRDLKQQILNNEYKKLQLQVEEQRANTVLLNALYNDQEAKEREESEKMKRSMQYSQELQQQLVNRQLQKQCQYEDTLIEKKMLDDIMRTIADEDQRELQQKREQMEKMRHDMVAFQQAREAWRRKQKEAVIAEEANIEAQRRATGDRSAALAAERQRKMKEKEEINEKITAKILADEAARQEREDIIKQLQEQEYLEKNCQDDTMERHNADRRRADTKDALTQQMNTRRRLDEEQRMRELEFRKQTEAKIAAENEKEADKERQKKEKARAYSMELLKQIDDNAARRARLRREEADRAQRVWDYDKAWLEEVSEERKKIVQEHAPHVVGWLQAGAIRTEDLPALREGARQHEGLAALDIDSLVVSDRPKRHPKCNDQCKVLREY